MPVIKKPRYVAQIKGERRSPFSPPPPPPLPSSPSLLRCFFSLLSLSLCALFFLLPAVACSVAQGRFISDEIVGKMSSRTERCKCASGGRLLASPVRKMNPDQGSSPLGKKTRPDSLKWLANLPYFTPRFGPTPIENCRSSVSCVSLRVKYAQTIPSWRKTRVVKLKSRIENVEMLKF